MKRSDGYRMTLVVVGFVTGLVLGGQSVSAAGTNQAPIAAAGSSRYAGPDPIVLDGTGSYDPDNSSPPSYAWRQIAGQTVVITDSNTATPTIGGFVQTDEIQECEFELVVSDGELTSLPDIVKVIIVPDWGNSTMQQVNPPFDPHKPTVINFAGGDCVTGGGIWNSTPWEEKANMISFPHYEPDSGGGLRTYYRCGDIIIVYLSSVAPDYKQPIQTIGHSTGADPAMDVGIHLNRIYRDARYAVNRVTQLDDACRYYENRDFYYESAELFLTSAVDGEQCWIDDYYGWEPPHRYFLWPDGLVVSLGLSHGDVKNWYRYSLTGNDMNIFNSGVVAGAYWSVIGPGKNLQLATGTDAFYFRWDGDKQSGVMSFFDKALHPGRLPEPVTLAAWINISGTLEDIDGAVLTCYESENAVGYELLFGSNPHRVMDYQVVSDTSLPPMDVIRDFPSAQTWWTVRVRDQFGSTIHADPIPLDLTVLDLPTVQNAQIGKRYGTIAHAILEAEPGDVILLYPATHDESIEFGAKAVTVSSLDPNDPNIVAATVVRGWDNTPTVSFSGPESAGCVLTGLTIKSDTVAVSCRDAAPTIQNCIIESPNGVAVEFWHWYQPTLIDCTLVGQIREGGNPGLIAYWKLDETESDTAYDSVGENHGTLYGNPTWQPEGGVVDGALEFDGTDDYLETSFALNPADGPFSVFAWIKGGAPGQVIISQAAGANWLMVDAGGELMTQLKYVGGRVAQPPLSSPAVITDGQWHRIGFAWDGAYRALYVDDILIVEDSQPGLADSSGGLNIGCGSDLTAGTFWSGLIDDVRIYNRAVKP